MNDDDLVSVARDMRDAVRGGMSWISEAEAETFACRIDRLAALADQRDERGGEVERYLADRFDWAAPGDQQQDAWLVRFCDKDCREAVFTGPDAEREAWEHYNRYAPSYNLYVFRLARLTTPTDTRGGESALREAAQALLDFIGPHDMRVYASDPPVRALRAALASPAAPGGVGEVRDHVAAVAFERHDDRKWAEATVAEKNEWRHFAEGMVNAVDRARALAARPPLSEKAK